jgi:hypothetical protein
MMEKFIITETFQPDEPDSDCHIQMFTQFPASKVRSYHEIVVMLPFEPEEFSAEVQDVKVLDHTVDYDPRIWGWTWRVETNSFKGGWLREVNLNCKLKDAWESSSGVLKRRWIVPPDPIQTYIYEVKLPDGYKIEETFAHFLTDISRVSDNEITFKKEYLEMGFKRFEFKLQYSA